MRWIVPSPRHVRTLPALIPFEEIVEHFQIRGHAHLDFTDATDAPQSVPVVRNGPEGRTGGPPLGPGAALGQNADSAARMINAAVRPSPRSRASEMPSSGAVWCRQPDSMVEEEGTKRTPYLIRVEGAPLYHGWDLVTLGGAGRALETFSVLTTEAAPSIADVHERMPVILHGHYGDWLTLPLPGTISSVYARRCQTRSSGALRWVMSILPEMRGKCEPWTHQAHCSDSLRGAGRWLRRSTDGDPEVALPACR